MVITTGGYKSLPFFKQTEIIHDFTVAFVKLYINLKSRTSDQMEQAARSGKQNISEGYLQKSLEDRIKLLGVARGSLKELLNDYLDFLRQRNLLLWDLNDQKAKIYLLSPESAANAMICLINQTNRLLDTRLRWTEEKFVREGGFRENLFKKRLAYRNQT
ncbi:MAG: hypothetical protein UV59_C0009G0024 [Candidatus Gottesmanbacteria bacterium GW2011_GWA1_43_11]|uniref:S23 ribosomal protein n=1 Tax=Candidatus Gottesmanbacteria bacterium GW2011_GWA1_43_11 TaxID=1618436 RepID=A0A0G1CI97_9BACT|nr:MAG: hypothetical protein UV59_C0009G0024 [Candidatus Gottesmanbacteria bacterium GW2011_GWA1_43_11]